VLTTSTEVPEIIVQTDGTSEKSMKDAIVTKKGLVKLVAPNT